MGEDHRVERDRERRERRRADRRLREERARRFEELSVAWRRNHPSEEDARKDEKGEPLA